MQGFDFNNHPQIDTKWIVFTGAPSSGKTTVLEALKNRGFHFEPETARIYIEQELAKGRTLQDVRKDEGEFQRGLLAGKLDLESRLDPSEITFLDRAMPDSIAYFQIAGLNPEEVRPYCSKFHYSKVFLFERLPLEIDHVRTEDEETGIQLENLLEEAYSSLGYSIVRVPRLSADKVISIQKRLEFILQEISPA